MITGNVLYRFYGLKVPVFNLPIKRLIWKIICKIEGGYRYSRILRRIMKDYHKVEIGMCSRGGCFVPGNMHAVEDRK